MKKPKPKKRKAILDYHECAEFIAHKLNIKDLRDVDGKFDPKNSGKSDQIEYKDFWHFLLDIHSFTNGCSFVMEDELLENWEKEDQWAIPIIKAFIKEFGEDAEYWVEW